jgi:hypothetical protein
MAITLASDIINDAAKALGKLGPGRGLSTSELEEGVKIFRRMVEAWNAKRAMIFSTIRETFPLIPNQALITIGPYGDWIAPRPLSIERMGVIVNPTGGVEIPVKVLSDQAKGVTGTLPTQCWYNDGWPLGELYFWPIPTTAYDIVLYHWQPLTVATGVDSIIRFPPGYEQAIVYGLAARLARPFGMACPPDVAREAQKAEGVVQSYNIKSPAIKAETFGRGRGGFNYITG